MAEQELAENTEAMAAAMAAAAVAEEIDAISSQTAGMSQDAAATGADPATAAGPAAAYGATAEEDAATTYLMVKELRAISRARSLRLQAEDLIVAIDGVPFHKDIETFLDVMFECDPENGRVLTIWRNGVLFLSLIHI